MAAPNRSPSSSVEVLHEIDEDDDLQRALALSMQDYCAAAGGGGESGAPAPSAAAAAVGQQREQQAGQDAPAQQQQQQGSTGPKKATPRQPMRGKRRQPEAASPHEQEAQQQPQRQQQAPVQATPRQQTQRYNPEEGGHSRQPQGQSPHLQQQPSKAASGPSPSARGQSTAAGGGGTNSATKQRQPRKKKLPAFNPSEAEVEACFSALAAGGGMVTVGSICEVSNATGGSLEIPAAQGMMAYAADKVLGWGSTAGRGQGTRGALSLPAFRQLIDHFRVA